MISTQDDAAMAAFLAHVEGCWHNLGRTEPHWSVITNPDFRADRIGDTVDGFYDTGREDVDRLIATGERFGFEFPRGGKCLELGCGVGRMTMWLARRFDRVIGLDVSASHLAIARRSILKRGCRNFELRLSNRLTAFDWLPEIDCFVSVIVLQHNPPPVMRWLLLKTLSRLRPGGVGVFQVPTGLPGYTFDAAAYLADPPAHGEMEMHAMSHEDVRSAIREAGCEVVLAYERDSIGVGDSFDFYVRRL